jgi:hypothetical protein
LTGTPAFCVHGHFYQPPREDPLTGEIPCEEGAAPYANWNQKIFHDCYKPNADAGNFEYISFNIGPTLCQWMEKYDPRTLAKIVEQENRCYVRYGVGNGMAQAYNHTILPLMSRRDKETQIRWGLADFRHRFGHPAAGMWLPETAVDLETLELLAGNGVKFTILAPWQADEPDLDITQPYRVDLPGGKNITIFFYEQDLSTRISFDPGATVNAEVFSRDFLAPKFLSANHHTELILTASDGELYGHHQPFREKFLNFLLSTSLKQNGIDSTFPGLWLLKHPPEKRVKIRENTSWSCHHGVTRWSGNCACASNGLWKRPFREGMLKIANELDEVYERELAKYILTDIWEVRHAYSQVMLGETKADEFIQTHFGNDINCEESQTIQYLLMAQYERQRMFTSCGWFFEDFDRIEPRNNVAYAAQAVWLTYLATGVNIEENAAGWLKPVISWRSGLSAESVFQQYMQRAKITRI